MEKAKEIVKAIYENPKVRLALKALALAVAAVVGEALGLGSMLANFVG